MKKMRKNIFVGSVVFLMLLSWVGLSTANTTFYHHDVLGTVVAETDESAQVTWWANYYPYGSKNQGNSPDTDPQKYTGKDFDEETGLYYFGARYYNPKLARFISIDPASGVSSNPQTWNRYAYALNNPYKYIDPDGRESRIKTVDGGNTYLKGGNKELRGFLSSANDKSISSLEIIGHGNSGGIEMV